jgi:hypothetical protein
MVIETATLNSSASGDPAVPSFPIVIGNEWLSMRLPLTGVPLVWPNVSKITIGTAFAESEANTAPSPIAVSIAANDRLAAIPVPLFIAASLSLKSFSSCSLPTAYIYA